jgi:hypothetical protein
VIHAHATLDRHANLLGTQAKVDKDGKGYGYLQAYWAMHAISGHPFTLRYFNQADRIQCIHFALHSPCLTFTLPNIHLALHACRILSAFFRR